MRTANADGADDLASSVDDDPRRPEDRSLFESPLLVFGLSLFIGLSFGWKSGVDVWKTNRFFDTDDAMHMVQARDWMAGQSWFDMIERRLGPPPGTLMHWTRIIDVPLAAFMKFFELFASQDTAERLTRLAYPAVLQIFLYVGVLWTARKLLGFRGVAAATFLAACSISAVVQFPLGRINHHDVQILCLIGMLGFSLDAIDRKYANRAALAAAFAALSLAVSIEDLPFIAAMIAAYAIAWIIRGEAFSSALAWFSGAMSVGLALAFAGVTPPSQYAARVCDEFSLAHLAPGVVGSAALFVLALSSARLKSRTARCIACLCAGALTFAALAAVAPGCIGDPYGGVDPLVHSVWLAHVSQAQPLLSVFREDFSRALPLALPVAFGALATSAAALRSRGDDRARWLFVAAFIWMGFLGSLWAVVVGTYAAALAVFGAAWAFEQFVDRTSPAPFVRGILGALLFLAATPEAWALIGAAISPPPKPADACFESKSYAAFGHLAPGLVLGPIDAGPYILAFTNLPVVDAPYHRDNLGNRLALEAMTEPLAAVREKMKASGATYFAFCDTLDETRLYEKLAPGGVLAAISRGNIPPWLSEVKPEPATPFRIFRIQ